MGLFAKHGHVAIAALGALAAAGLTEGAGALGAGVNPWGIARTVVTRGTLDPDHPFFRRRGAAARSCGACHDPAEGWTVTPAGLRARFDATGGADPVFHPADGATSPGADVSTPAARRAAYRLLLDRGLVRVGLPLPADAEFDLVAVDDPYAHASARELSLFRRPPPATNLRFAASLMWDGRESPGAAGLAAALSRQAGHAARDHLARARPLDATERDAIVALEMALITAQAVDSAAGDLRADGASGGPDALASQEGIAAVPAPFTLFDAWAVRAGPVAVRVGPVAVRAGPVAGTGAARRAADARAAIARGQAIFNGRAFARAAGRCASCHTTANTGGNAAGLFFDLGLTRITERRADVPLYTFRCRASGQVVRTTDPGRALVTGKCEDFNRFKVPTLRGLAARAPYFHDGSAPTLERVIDVYERTMGLGLTPSERMDLVAFLRAL